MADYVFKPGKFGEKLVLQADWDDACIRVMSKRSCTELEVNYAAGFRGPNIDFLAKVPFLTALVLIAYHISDISPIHHLHNLKALNLGTRAERCEIDFTQFPVLEDCAFDWRAKARTLFQCGTLRRLWLNKYSAHDCSAFRGMSSLRQLYLASAPLRSVSDLSALAGLHTLGLYYLTKLPSLDGVQHLTSLEELDIKNCRLISSVEEVRPLSELRRLSLDQCGDIESLKPLRNLRNLEMFFAPGSTNIVDGDLTPLRSLPRLQRVALRGRRHYSPKREAILPNATSHPASDP